MISVSNILGTKRAEKKRWGGVLGREGVSETAQEHNTKKEKSMKEWYWIMKSDLEGGGEGGLEIQ